MWSGQSSWSHNQIEPPQTHGIIVLSTDLLLLTLRDFKQFLAVPLCSVVYPKKDRGHTPLAAPQPHPALAREHRSPLCVSLSKTDSIWHPTISLMISSCLTAIFTACY